MKYLMKGPVSLQLPAGNGDEFSLDPGWVAISQHWIKTKKERRELYGTLCRIKSEEGVVYRYLHFRMRMKKSVMLLDWAGWIDLNGRTGDEKQSLDISIRKANVFEKIYYSYSHPDPMFRHSMYANRISLYLAIISVLIAFK